MGAEGKPITREWEMAVVSPCLFKRFPLPWSASQRHHNSDYYCWPITCSVEVYDIANRQPFMTSQNKQDYTLQPNTMSQAVNRGLFILDAFLPRNDYNMSGCNPVVWVR